jgi:hypothetical protein
MTRAIREGGLQIRAPQLINSFPVNIRGPRGYSVISLEHKLDKYLHSIPDKPKTPS